MHLNYIYLWNNVLTVNGEEVHRKNAQRIIINDDGSISSYFYEEPDSNHNKPTLSIQKNGYIYYVFPYVQKVKIIADPSYTISNSNETKDSISKLFSVLQKENIKEVKEEKMKMDVLHMK